MCEQTKHSWRNFGVGFVCAQCQEKKFKEYNAWLISKYGDDIQRHVDKYTGSIRYEVDEFLQATDEAERKEMEQEYAAENARFIAMSST